MTRRSRLLALAVVAAGALVSGCAVPDPGAGQAAATDPPSADAQYRVPEGGQRTGAVATSITSDQTFTLQGAVGDDGGVDFAAYDESMDFALGAISEYWIETMAADFGEKWVQPDEFIAYYPPEDDGPTCGGQPVGAVNAVYCSQPESDFIAWDEPGLMLPFYQEKGDMATAVILAHEFGHGAQARLGLTEQFPLTIESELQADCFAGAWAQWAENQGLLGKQAIKQAVDAVISVADPDGVPWNAPDAHGTAEERLTAFADGADYGATGSVEGYYPGFSSEG